MTDIGNITFKISTIELEVSPENGFARHIPATVKPTSETDRPIVLYGPHCSLTVYVSAKVADSNYLHAK